MRLWFGCYHRNLGFPITRPSKQRQLGRLADTYVVCLDCGHEMPYSWNEMRVIKERRRPDAEESTLFDPAVPA
jgi:hypothetical protein